MKNLCKKFNVGILIGFLTFQEVDLGGGIGRDFPLLKVDSKSSHKNVSNA